jgi:ABC-type histidine transport system ATPase subunit
MPADAPLLDVQELQKRFGKTEVLKGISMAVPKGEVVAILGPCTGRPQTQKVVAIREPYRFVLRINR